MKEKEDIYDHVHGPMTIRSIKVLDHGYVRFIESWGKGDTGIHEAGIIEAARQSTQGSFRGWEPKHHYECRTPQCKNGYSCTVEAKRDDLECPNCSSPLTYNPEKSNPGDQKLLAFLFNNKPPHATPFEFAGMVIEVQAPIFVFREWHRHRTQSFNEMSARYAPLPDLNYMPTADRCLMVSSANKQAGAAKGSDEVTHESALQWLDELQNLYAIAEGVYQSGLKRGLPKEVARVCLPVGRYSRMRAQTNLRNWLAFLTLRSDPGAQWEIRQFSDAVGTIIVNQFPKTWELFSNRT